MDEETKKFIEEVREKYKDNREVQFLLLELANLEIKLIGADIMAMAVDVAVRRGILDSRCLISDTRNDYGSPWEYEFADKKLLMEYKGGIDEVIEAVSKKK